MSLCDSCVATCCRTPVRLGVTELDLERLGPLAALVVPGSLMEHGYVGEVPKLESGACVFLRGHRCSIYDRRPQACRDQKVDGCVIYRARSDGGISRPGA